MPQTKQAFVFRPTPFSGREPKTKAWHSSAIPLRLPSACPDGHLCRSQSGCAPL